MNWIHMYTVYALLISAVSGQEYTDTVTVGSLSHDNNLVTVDRTFILAGYTVPCSGTVVAWEFCYQIQSATSVTFYPGIWRITGTMSSNTDYTLVQSNTVTHNASVRDPQDPTNIYPCQIFKLSDTDQFTAPAGSVVGLYSNVMTQLLHTNTDSSITTYRFMGNQSIVTPTGNSNDVNYNIAIRVHLGGVVNVSTATSTEMQFTSTQIDDMSTIFPIYTIVSVSSTIAPITTATTMSTTTAGTKSNSGDSSSTVVGVVVGCVVGVVIFVVIIFILLVWYQRRKRWRKKGILGVVHCSNSELKDSERFSDHQYSLIKHNAAMNGVITVESNYETADNAGYYSSADNGNNSSGKTIEMTHYMDSTSSTRKDYAKASSIDYEALPTLTEYETLYSQISSSYTPYQYEVAVTSIFRDDMEYSTASEALSDNEEIYEDPGHGEEKIYAWFEKKKFPKIKINNIKILQVLGSGEFGTVHLGLWSNGSTDPVQVAVKTLNSQCSESDRGKFLREAAIMGQFVHNNVVQLHGVVTEEENMMIVLEYMPKGDLRDNLIDFKNNNEYWSLPVKLLRFCRQIAAGMSYLANKQFVHRDLAARNILVSSDDVCKIADFGMARDVGDDIYYITTGGKIPLKWTAPEAIFYKKYSVQSDVWSFGCVMYEIWSLGHKLAEDLNGKEYVQKITTGYRLPPPPGCPRAVYELMIQCWHPTAKNRPLPGLVLQILQNSDRVAITYKLCTSDR